MSLFLKVRFDNSKWVGASDYRPAHYVPTLAVDRAKGGGSSGIAGVVDSQSQRYVLALLEATKAQTVLCKFETDCDDVWYATCDLSVPMTEHLG